MTLIMKHSKNIFDELTGLAPEARYQYIVQYAKTLYRRDKKADAEKLLDELKSVQVPESQQWRYAGRCPCLDGQDG